MNLDIELVSNRPANRRDDLLGHHSVGMSFDFLNDRELLLSVDLDGEGRGASCTERRMTPLRCPLDVLGIDVPSAEDDQVFEPAGDEEHTILQKAKVARPQKRPHATLIQVGAQSFLRLRGSPPVALRDARPRDPDLADSILGALDPGRRIDDDDAMTGGDFTARGKALALAGLFRLGDLAAPESLGVDREDDRRGARGTARDEQCRLGQAVTGQKRLPAEPGRGKCRCEAVERLRADRLGAIERHSPAAQVQIGGAPRASSSPRKAHRRSLAPR